MHLICSVDFVFFFWLYKYIQYKYKKLIKIIFFLNNYHNLRNILLIKYFNKTIKIQQYIFFVIQYKFGFFIIIDRVCIRVNRVLHNIFNNYSFSNKMETISTYLKYIQCICTLLISFCSLIKYINLFKEHICIHKIL